MCRLLASSFPDQKMLRVRPMLSGFLHRYAFCIKQQSVLSWLYFCMPRCCSEFR